MPVKTFNRDALARRIKAMTVGKEFQLPTEAERSSALRSGKELFRSGAVEFVLRTWVNQDGTYTVRAVKP